MTTNHYGLENLGAGDDLSDHGYKFTGADRDLMDRLLYLGAEGHHHTGADAVVSNPADAPDLELHETGGTIPAGTRVYYKFSWVDVNGFESAASPEGYVDTPDAISSPDAPTITYDSTGGTLLPGVYYYILTAFSPVNTAETKATAPAYITVPVGTSTNAITLDMPTLPAGADGWNVYVKRPGQVRYNYLASVTIGTQYIDDGGTEEDCNRTIPVANATNSTNSVTITLPEVLPDGATWKVYRTYITGQYDNTLLHWVVEETFETSGIIVDFYEDVGNATIEGYPPAASQAIGSPEKIDLTDAAEVTGTLPMGRVEHPEVITFFWPGTLATVEGTMVWVCEFPEMRIVGCRATLGRGSTPNGQSVIIDVNKGHGATPGFTTIYPDQADRPRILVGHYVGDRTEPDATAGHLVEGDCLTVDIDQAGGGATPTDFDLTISIYAVAFGFDADET